MQSQSRQLAAIMFTDIVGYTALMGNDEQKAFDLLNKNRQVQKPIIEQYNGKWIKEIGDGVMASFNTVSDAVSAAIKIQQTCNASKEFQLRIGIHLGEVVFENADVSHSLFFCRIDFGLTGHRFRQQVLTRPWYHKQKLRRHCKTQSGTSFVLVLELNAPHRSRSLTHG